MHRNDQPPTTFGHLANLANDIRTDVLSGNHFARLVVGLHFLQRPTFPVGVPGKGTKDLLVTRQQSIEFGQVGKIVILFAGHGKTFRQGLLDRFLLGLGESLCLGKRREKQDPEEQGKKATRKGSENLHFGGIAWETVLRKVEWVRFLSPPHAFCIMI